MTAVPVWSNVFICGDGGWDEPTALHTTRTWPNPEDIGDFSFIVYGDNRYATSSPNFNGEPVPYGTLASTAVEGEWPEAPNHEIDISGVELNSGWNYVAVQVHQASATSSDVSFDLEIVGREPQE